MVALMYTYMDVRKTVGLVAPYCHTTILGATSYRCVGGRSASSVRSGGFSALAATDGFGA